MSHAYAADSPLRGLWQALEKRMAYSGPFHTKDGETPLLTLSLLGVPAWQTLYAVWMYWVYYTLAKNEVGRFRDPREWKRLVELAENFAENLAGAPLIPDIPEEIRDREILIRRSKQWAVEMSKTPLVTNDFYLAVGVTAAGAAAAIKVMLPKRKGVGNKSRPPELDPTTWLSAISYWVRQAAAKSGTEQACWTALAEIGRVFFNIRRRDFDGANPREQRIRNLEDRFRALRKRHGDNDLARLANAIAAEARQFSEPPL
jgi:hypothetical protein